MRRQLDEPKMVRQSAIGGRGLKVEGGEKKVRQDSVRLLRGAKRRGGRVRDWRGRVA